MNEGIRTSQPAPSPVDDLYEEAMHVIGDFGSHHYWCWMIDNPTSERCTCGFKRALDNLSGKLKAAQT